MSDRIKVNIPKIGTVYYPPDLDLDEADRISQDLYVKAFIEDLKSQEQESILPSQAAGRTMQFIQTPLPESLGMKLGKPTIPGVYPEEHELLPKEVGQMEDVLTENAAALSSPLGIGMMAAGGTLAAGAPSLARAMGLAFGAPQIAGGIKAAQEGNIPKAVADIGMGSLAVLPTAIKAVQPLTEIAKEYAPAAWEATKQTLDIGGDPIYGLFGKQAGSQRLGGNTIVPSESEASLVLSSELNSQNIPSNPDLAISAPSALRAAENPAGLPFDILKITRGLQQERQFMANAGDLIGEWIERFRNNRIAQKIYSPKDMDDLVSGLRMTAKIFGDEYPDPVIGESPLRENSDKLFKETYDLSTICPQQDQYVAVVRQVENMTGGLLDPYKRFLVGRMMLDAGEAPACFECYGQAKRDLAEWSVDKASNIFRNASQVLNSENPTRERLQEAFGGWTSYDKKTGEPSQLMLLTERYKDNRKAHKLFDDPVRLRDMVFAGAEPRNPVEADIAATVRESIQGGIKPNMPKQYAQYNGQLLSMRESTIQQRNKSAGLRMNSQTDFRIWHILNVEQFLADAMTKKAMVHVYTRQPAFIDIFGDTGIKFNISLEFAHGPDGKIMRNPDGSPMINSMQTMPWEKIMEFRKKYPKNVGSMLVAMTDEDIAEAMRNPNIDMMIPYHKGSVSDPINQFMGAKDYSKWQHEKWPEKYKSKQKVPVTLSNGQRVTLQVGAPITREHHFNDPKLYLELANKLGFEPRYSNLLKQVNGEWRAPKGYMKAIIDVARDPSNQSVVDPRKINWDAAQKHVQKWVESGGDQPQIQPKPALVKYIMDRIENNEWPKVSGLPAENKLVNITQGKTK